MGRGVIIMANINGNEASVVDIKVIKQLETLGFVLNDTLLYQHSYQALCIQVP